VTHKIPSAGKRRRRSDGVLKFTFDDAITPQVHKIVGDKESYSIYDEIELEGQHFSTNNAENIVKFGKHICTATESTATSIKCKVDSTEVIQMYVKLELSFSVKGIGEGKVNILNANDRAVLFKPTIQVVTPSTGSFSGGATLTLSGAGLDRKSLQVKLAGKACVVESRDYNTLKCLTPVGEKMGGESTKSVDLILCDSADVDEWGECKEINTARQYTYSNVKTSTVSELQPRVVDEPTKNLVATVTGLAGGDVNELSIKLESSSDVKETFSCTIRVGDSDLTNDPGTVCFLI